MMDLSQYKEISAQCVTIPNTLVICGHQFLFVSFNQNENENPIEQRPILHITKKKLCNLKIIGFLGEKIVCKLFCNSVSSSCLMFAA